MAKPRRQSGQVEIACVQRQNYMTFYVWRNLCKGVHGEISKKLPEKDAHKLDLVNFEHVFNWQDSPIYMSSNKCSRDSNLMLQEATLTQQRLHSTSEFFAQAN
eukprot:6457744-Amphidinium_carterae.1